MVDESDETEVTQVQQESSSNYIESNMEQIRGRDRENQNDQALDHNQQKSNDNSLLGQKLYKLTPEEEENLAAYLDLGMSIKDACEHFKKEIEVAEMTQKIRDNVRQQNRGSINATKRTQIRPTHNNGGRGPGGLSYN